MRRVITSGLAIVTSCALMLGCSEHSKTTSKTEVKTPGGTTTETIQKDVKKTGDHKDK